MVTIRLLNGNDWSAWKAIRLEALQTQPEAFGSSYEEALLLQDDEFKQGLTDNDIFGAFVDEQLVGCAGFCGAKLLKMQHRGTLISLYVKQPNRGQQIGDKLVKTIIEHARPKVLQLHCMVTTENQAAINLYRKHGFMLYGTEPRALKINGRFYDEHLMVLKLD